MAITEREAVEAAVQRRCVSIVGAAEMLDVGERTVAAMVADGRLRHIKIGRRTLIPVAVIDAYIQEQLGA